MSKILQFRFNENSITRLDQLKENSGAATRTETVRRALRFYEAIVKYSNDGYEIQFANSGETIKVAFV